MSITANDKRTPAAGFSTGTPASAAVDESDTLLVQPLRSFLEGSRMVTVHSEPFHLPRHYAEGLKADGLVAIVPPKDPPVDPEDDTVEIDETEETEVEQPDDRSRAPDQSQVTASSVPALPGAAPSTPAPGVVPPAATTDLPAKPRRGRRRAAD